MDQERSMLISVSWVPYERLSLGNHWFLYFGANKTILQTDGEGVLSVGGRSGGAIGARDETTHSARDHHGVPPDGCELGYGSWVRQWMVEMTGYGNDRGADTVIDYGTRGAYGFLRRGYCNVLSIGAFAHYARFIYGAGEWFRFDASFPEQ